MEFEFWSAPQRRVYFDFRRHAPEWDISGPLFAGWEIYHIKGSPADPNRLYASQSSGWFGQLIQRSNDGGKTWEPRETNSRTTACPARISFSTARRIPGSSSACGIWSHRSPIRTRFTPVSKMRRFFIPTMAGKSWQELSGLRGHGSGPSWHPGAGGMCLHTIVLDPSDPRRMYIAISAAGAFRTDDEGATWQPINQGLSSQYIPDPTAEVGHCVHRIAMHRSRPNVLFMQKHWDVMRSDNARRFLARGERQPADRFWFRRSTFTRMSRKPSM